MPLKLKVSGFSQEANIPMRFNPAWMWFRKGCFRREQGILAHGAPLGNGVNAFSRFAGADQPFGSKSAGLLMWRSLLVKDFRPWPVRCKQISLTSETGSGTSKYQLPPGAQLLSPLPPVHPPKKEGASNLTAVLPYLVYARHDARNDKGKPGQSMATTYDQ